MLTDADADDDDVVDVDDGSNLADGVDDIAILRAHLVCSCKANRRTFSNHHHSRSDGYTEMCM